MNRDEISELEFGILSTYFLKVFIFISGINILLNINKNDSIISIIIGILLGTLIIKAFNSLRENDIFITINNCFSKPNSIIIKVLLLITSIIMSCYLLYSISIFIKTALLNKVDILPISILFILTSFYSYKKGIKTIIKSSFICFFIFLLLEIISFLFLMPEINSLKILPLSTQSISNITLGSITYITLSILPIFMLLVIPSKKEKKKTKLFYILTSIYTLFSFVLILSVINANLATQIDYPQLFILSKISVINFFDRMEGILCFKYLFDSFFTLSVLLYYITKAIDSIFYKLNKKTKKLDKYIIYFIILIIIFFSNYIEFNNTSILITLSIFGIVNILIAFKNFIKT